MRRTAERSVGLTATAIKRNEDVVQTLYERILGRTTVHDVYDPHTGELIVAAGEEITEAIAEAIDAAHIESVEYSFGVDLRVSSRGLCRNVTAVTLATGRMVQKGEVVGVIAAQSIGEPGTQLTLRTFHVGGVAGGVATDNSVVSRYEGRLEIDDLRVIKSEVNGKEVQTVISRLSELRIVDVNTDIVLYTTQTCLMDRRSISTMEIWVKKGDLVCEWDPYNAVIISEYDGKVAFRKCDRRCYLSG